MTTTKLHAPLSLQEAYRLFLDRVHPKNPQKLLLINPPQVPEDMFSRDIALLKGYYAFPPSGLLYIAAAARSIKPDIGIEILDLNYEMLKRGQSDSFSYDFWKGVVFEKIKSSNGNVQVGVSCMFGATKPIFLEITKFIHDSFDQISILTGGVQASYDYKELLEQNYCDIVFRKESEVQIQTYIRSQLEDDASLIPQGAAFKVQDRIFETPPASEGVPVDLDIRPFYPLLDLEHYNELGSLAAFSRYNGEEKPFATVLTNRGCRAMCTFCTVRDFNGMGVRQRPVSSVLDELKYLYHERGIRQIDWLDDDLLFNKERAIELFKGMADQLPGLEWISNNGLIAAAVSEDVMEWMAKSGCKAFKVGIESGNDAMLIQIKKPTTKDKLREKSILFKKYPSIFFSGNFIIGFPKETFGQMLDTFNFACELGWDWASYYICQPLKGTQMFSVFQSLGDERCDYENYDKTLNPGRAAVRGEFGYHKGYHPDRPEDQVLSGRDIFKLPKDLIPSKDQIREIWFTFNLLSNFIDNPNFKSKANMHKMVRWFESIASAYPFDLSMCAALSFGHHIAGDTQAHLSYKTRFYEILKGSAYWRKRAEEFPELEQLAQ